MAELNDLSVLAANNTGRAPEGWKGPAMNDAFRELEAMIKRHLVDNSGEGITTGTGSAYVLSSSRSAALAAGWTYLVKLHVDCLATPTFKPGSAAAKTIVRQDGSAIEAGDMLAQQMVSLVYNASLDKWMAQGVGTPYPDAPSYTEAGLPAASRAGRLALVTDYGADNVPALAIDNGSAWSYLSQYIQTGTASARNALTGNYAGRFHIVTDAPGSVDVLSYYDGSAWVNIDDILQSYTTGTRGTAANVGRLIYMTDNSGLAAEPVLALDCTGRTGDDWMEISDRLPEYTVATLPTASNHPRKMVYVTNGASGPGVAVSTGSLWKWVAATAGSSAIWQTVS